MTKEINVMHYWWKFSEIFAEHDKTTKEANATLKKSLEIKNQKLEILIDKQLSHAEKTHLLEQIEKNGYSLDTIPSYAFSDILLNFLCETMPIGQRIVKKLSTSETVPLSATA